MVARLGMSLLLSAGMAAAQDGPPTRELNGINWIDFQRWVPERIDTVLLPVGTLEAHGVANNGADNTVPEALARDLATRLEAMIAPTISYGFTTSLSAFPGTFRVDPQVFQAYSAEVIRGLSRSGFRHIVVLNGHGPNFELLEQACAEASEQTGVRTLVLNWWTLTADITRDVYGTDGGHAGVNETAAVLATTPEFVHPGHYDPQQAWWRQPGLSAYPFPSSIILYEPEQGYPDFDVPKARRFYERVVTRLESLIETTIEKWRRMEKGG